MKKRTKECEASGELNDVKTTLSYIAAVAHAFKIFFIPSDLIRI